MEDNLLKEYYRHLECAPLQTRNVTNVRRWLAGNKPLIPAESHFINFRDDLVTPAFAAERSSVEVGLENLLACVKRLGFLNFSKARTCETSYDEGKDPSLIHSNRTTQCVLMTETSFL